MKNRILFLGYWNIDDGLTHSTIIPHLRILKNLESVDYLHFANTQREKIEEVSLTKINELEIDYSPLFSKNFAVNQLNKIYDFIYFPKLIKEICSKKNINMIIARGAPSGALAYLSTIKNKIPFVVESFEPHAAYMKSAGEWRTWGLRYLFQRYWEEKQKERATALITVSKNYKCQLLKEGVKEGKIFVAPCAVDTDTFYEDNELRKEIRSQLQICEEAKVGIYVGKFGGLYLEEDAFRIFRQAFDQIPSFELILLTGTSKNWLRQQMVAYQLPSNRIHVKFVSYEEVNTYLNAADFAFALYKSNSVSPYLSPVKIGEYWACGLPVFMTPNLGDEKDWIESEGLGRIINSQNIKFVSDGQFSTTIIKEKGLEIRSLKKIRNEYLKIIN